MIDAVELEQALAGLTGSVEVREDGQRIASLANFRHEVRVHGRRVVLHLWSDERSLARAVVRIAHKETGRLLLEVECFGRTKPGRLEFASVDLARSEKQVSRDQFREEFGALLREQFPDEEIEIIANAADLEHSLSGRYVRAMVRSGSNRWAVLAAGPGESAAAIDAMLTFGLIWMEHSRVRVTNGRVAGLRLFFPKRSAPALAHRVKAIDPRYEIEVYAIERELGRARRVHGDDHGNLLTRLVPRGETDRLLEGAEREIAPIRALAEKEISATPICGSHDVALRFRGAQFAWWHEGAIYFEAEARGPKVLTHGSRSELERIVSELRTFRDPNSGLKTHPLYRAQAERWLETIVAADVREIDSQIDHRFVYSQVPAFSAGDRGVIDLLCATRTGRLAILELKADEDIHLPMQAADYWLRVRRHQMQGDLREYGYFPGVELRDDPPLAYLIAPAIRFHPATSTVLRYLSPEIQVIRVGLAEDWRRELKVVLRQ